MRVMFTAALAALALASCTTTPPAYRVLNPNEYQSFVGNWTPEDHPLCAALQSAADWDKVMHPAATMNSHAFAPSAEVWQGHAILLLARVVNAGDTSHVFNVSKVSTERNALVVDYAFAPTPAASSTEKYYFALEVAKPLAATIRFREGGNVVCEVAPGGVSPASD